MGGTVTQDGDDVTVQGPDPQNPVDVDLAGFPDQPDEDGPSDESFTRQLPKVDAGDREITEETVDGWAYELVGALDRWKPAQPGPATGYEALINLNQGLPRPSLWGAGSVSADVGEL